MSDKSQAASQPAPIPSDWSLRYPNAEFLPVGVSPMTVFGPAGPQNAPITATFNVVNVNFDQENGGMRSAVATAPDDYPDQVFNIVSAALAHECKRAFNEKGEGLKDLTQITGRDLKITGRASTNWAQTNQDRKDGIKKALVLHHDGLDYHVWGTQITVRPQGHIELIDQVAAPTGKLVFRANNRNTGVLMAEQNRSYGGVVGANALADKVAKFAELSVE